MAIEAVQKWQSCAKLKWVNVASPLADETGRSSPVARAWKRTVAWLRVAEQAHNPDNAKVSVLRLLNYDHKVVVNDPNLSGDAAAFIAWRQALTFEALRSKAWITAFTAVAAKELPRTQKQSDWQPQSSKTGSNKAQPRY